MSAVVVILAVLAVALLAAGVGFAMALARRGQQRLGDEIEILPGVETGAPTAWAGSHDPEAKLHRRLVTAIRGLRAQADLGYEGVDELELRVELEQHAVTVDKRLVGAATLPPQQRGPALAEVEVSVAAIESAAAELGRTIAQGDASVQVRGLEDLSARIKGMSAEG